MTTCEEIECTFCVCIEYCNELWVQHQERSMTNALVGESPDGMAECFVTTAKQEDDTPQHLFWSPQCAFCGESVGVRRPEEKEDVDFLRERGWYVSGDGQYVAFSD